MENLMEESSRLDIVGQLAAEVGLHVFSFLGPVQLALCSRVSRQWRALADDNKLWKRYTPLQEKKVHPQNECGREHKAMYCREAKTLCNWKRGKYWEWEVESCEELVPLANGAVVLRSVQDRLEVYDLNEGSPTLLQTLVPPKPWLETRPPFVSADGCSLAVETCYNHLYAFYRWSGNMLELIGCVMAEGGPPRLVSWRWEDQPRTRPRVLSLHHIDPDMTAVFSTSNQELFSDHQLRVFFWSATGSETLAEVCLEGPLHAVDSTPALRVVLYSGSSVVVCSAGGQVLLTVPVVLPDPILSVKAYSNSVAHLGVFLTSRARSYSAWTDDWRPLGPAFALDTAPEEGALLHPRLRVLLYVDSEKGFCAEDIETHSTLWTVLAIGKIGVTLKSCFLTDKYLCFVETALERRGSSSARGRPQGLVVDLDNRTAVKFILRVPLATRGTIVGRKCIITKRHPTSAYTVMAFT